MNLQMKKLIFPFLLASILFISCSSKAKSGVEITGKLSNSSNEKLFLDELTASSITPKDSIVVGSDGSFKFAIKVPELGFYRIRLDNSNFALLLLDSSDKLDFTADAKNFASSYTIKGSEECQKIADVNKVLQRNYFLGDSLKKVFAAFQNTPKMDSVGRALDMKYNLVKQNESKYLKDFIDKNSTSLASLTVIDRLSSETDVDYYIKLDKGLNAKYPNSSYVKMFHSRVGEMNKLGIGSIAPEITLPTPDGKTVSLSSYRGKVVLVDFWASWCRPCRAENPTVVKAYNNYHAKGFEVLGVSLDKDKAAWQKAIADDHLTWTHISDLGMWSSSVVKLYNLNGIPFSVLLDKEGKIIAKGLRGEELENTLRKLLP
jgi:peroxiredoxin